MDPQLLPPGPMPRQAGYICRYLWLTVVATATSLILNAAAAPQMQVPEGWVSSRPATVHDMAWRHVGVGKVGFS